MNVGNNTLHETIESWKIQFDELKERRQSFDDPKNYEELYKDYHAHVRNDVLWFLKIVLFVASSIGREKSLSAENSLTPLTQILSKWNLA